MLSFAIVIFQSWFLCSPCQANVIIPWTPCCLFRRPEIYCTSSSFQLCTSFKVPGKRTIALRIAMDVSRESLSQHKDSRETTPSVTGATHEHPSTSAPAEKVASLQRVPSNDTTSKASSLSQRAMSDQAADFRPTWRFTLAIAAILIVTLAGALDATSLSVALPVSSTIYGHANCPGWVHC